MHNTQVRYSNIQFTYYKTSYILLQDKEKEWQGSTFTSDQDGKVSAKFRKLMGMKDSDGKEEHGDLPDDMTEEQKRKQAELFSRLDKEYEFARMTTHTQRGVGLGFSSHPIYPAGSGGAT